MTAALDFDAPHDPGLHPLIHALKWIAMDLLSTFAFVGLFAVTHSALAATLLALAAGLAQMGFERLRHRRIDAMQVMSLALVVVFGSASLLTHDPRFIMLKPTLIYVAVGAIMLKPGWMARYMPEIVMTYSAEVVVTFGYVWAAMMFITAALNAGFAIADRGAWVGFIAIFPITSKIGLVLLQYAVIRWMTTRRVRRALGFGA